MTIDDVLKYFGSMYRFRQKTSMSVQGFCNWKKRGYIPINSQIKIEKLTDGALKASLEHIHDVNR